MNAYIQKHSSKIIGVLSGFDRLVLRGVLRRLTYEAGMFGSLCGAGVCLKDFGQHALRVTERLKQASLRHAQDTGGEIRYSGLQSASQGAHRPPDRSTRSYQSSVVVPRSAKRPTNV